MPNVVFRFLRWAANVGLGGVREEQQSIPHFIEHTAPVAKQRYAIPGFSDTDPDNLDTQAYW